MLYCPGSGQELLSALGVIVVCQDSKNFLMRELPLSMIDALLKINDMVMRPSMISNLWLIATQKFAVVDDCYLVKHY